MRIIDTINKWKKTTKEPGINKETNFVNFTFDPKTKQVKCDVNFCFYEDLDDERNLSLAEEYAIFCYGIISHKEEVFRQVIEEIKKKKKTSNHNLLNYHNVYQFILNFINTLTNKDTNPIIRPTEVFNIRSQIIETDNNE